MNIELGSEWLNAEQKLTVEVIWVKKDFIGVRFKGLGASGFMPIDKFIAEYAQLPNLDDDN